MTTLHVRVLAIGSLALLAFAAGVAGQDRSTVLNTLEVRQLVERAEPDDHARLGAHFAALAEKYAADSTRHSALSKAMGGNPNRQVAAGSGAHFARLASLNSQEAATLRELATHHERLAAGSSSIAPRGGARFENGAGARAPTDRELTALAAAARTPSDHFALQEYFATLANRYTAEAEEHASMAQAYRGNPNRRGGDMAVHCDRLVKLSRESAAEARGAAADHGRWATIS